jgi:hypothetical protein
MTFGEIWIYIVQQMGVDGLQISHLEWFLVALASLFPRVLQIKHNLRYVGSYLKFGRIVSSGVIGINMEGPRVSTH